MIVSNKPEENPYVLDYVKDTEIPALTRKNADFIEAIIGLDSNYGKDLKKSKPSNNFDPDKIVELASGSYCGSTAYWFEEMKKPDANFKKCLLGAIIAIDRTNSTHLEASENGRVIMRDRICSRCNNWHGLVELLNKKFSLETSPKDEHIISLLTKEMEAKKGGIRFNLSFATKFCAYASKFLNAENEYSKYDNVVSDQLPKYEELYLNNKVKKNKYKINQNEAKKYNEKLNDGLQYRLKTYNEYQETIKNILKQIKRSENTSLTYEEFDHIVWYCFKGRAGKDSDSN